MLNFEFCAPTKFVFGRDSQHKVGQLVREFGGSRALIVYGGGSVIRSVEQITCAGNFLSVMKDIEAVGSDLRFGIPGGGRFGTPSLLISKVIISGK